MFEYEPGEAVTPLVDTTYRHLVDAEATLLELAAHWAGRHSQRTQGPGSPGRHDQDRSSAA